MFDGKAFGQEIVAAVKGHIDRTLQPVLERINALEARFDALPQPVEIDADQIAILAVEKGEGLRVAMQRQIDDLRGAIEGIEIPAFPDVATMIEEAIDPLPDAADMKAAIDAAVAAIPAPQNGKDADPEHVAALVKQEAERILAGWERPKDGKKGDDGAPGLDGKDGRDGVGIAGTFMDFHGNLAVTTSDGRVQSIGRVRGKDGAPGKDGIDGKDGRDGVDGKDGVPGRDGFGFDDFDMVYDGERTFTMKFARAADVREFVFNVPVVLDRGVWRQGEYKAGDGVTWGGSFWIAQRDNSDKPDSGDGSWRLAVRRGRDGKDFDRKDPPKRGGPVKVG